MDDLTIRRKQAGGKLVETRWIFVLGAAGALAPEIVRLYNIRRDEPQSFSLFYFVISLIFASLGGLVAVILPTTTALAAFYAGVSTPTVINSALRQGMKRPAGALRGPTSPAAPRSSKIARFIDAL